MAAADSELAVLVLQVVDLCGDGGRVAVRQLEVINMPANGHLCAVDDLVGNTGVIGIHLEASTNQVSEELAVEEQSRFN